VTASKKKLHRQYGNIDVEHLAMDLYRAFHDEGEADIDPYPWPPYKKQKTDRVVQQFRRYALAVARMAEIDAEYRGLGSALYRDVP